MKKQGQETSVHDRVERVKQQGLEVRSLSALQELIDIAGQDKSPGVRLNAAASATQALARRLQEEPQWTLTLLQRRTLLRELRKRDPRNNPGLFSVMAALDLPESLGTLFTGMNDPRQDVRVGALVGLRRLAFLLLNDPAAEEDLKEDILELLHQAHLPQDSRGWLCDMAIDFSWSFVREYIETPIATDQLPDWMISAMKIRLDARSTPLPLEGPWQSFSSDPEVGSFGEAAWFVLGDKLGLHGASSSVEPIRWLEGSDGGIRVRRGNQWEDWSIRPMTFRPQGLEHPLNGFWMQGRLWFPCEQEQRNQLVLDAMSSCSKLDRKRRLDLLPLLKELTPSGKSRSMMEVHLLLFGGEPAAALEAVERLKWKSRPALLLLRGRCLRRLNRYPEAHECLERCLELTEDSSLRSHALKLLGRREA